MVVLAYDARLHIPAQSGTFSNEQLIAGMADGHAANQ
jgi:hypothetical protein